MKMVWRALLAVVLGAAMLPFLSSTAQADTTYTLTGTVTGRNSSGSEVGIADVQVEVWSSDGSTDNWVDETTYTGSDGTYSITVPRTGHYEYFAYCNGDCHGYDDQRVSDVSVQGDKTLDMHLSLLTTLSLTVKDNTGAPITRPLDVTAYSASGNSDDIGVTGPTSGGVYTLTDVSADTSISVNDDLDGLPVYENWYTDDSPAFLSDSATPQSHTITLGPWTGIRAKAEAPDGSPLKNVRWNVFTKQAEGSWDDGLQMGPLLTDDDGAMSWAGKIGTSYKFCFYDDDYDFNTRSQRYADACYGGATKDAATVWTPTEQSPVLTTTMTLQPDGDSLTVGHPWVDGTAKVGQSLTARPGTWGPSGVALTYQWYTDSSTGPLAPIAGATHASFTPTAAQQGRIILVGVTGTLAGYRTHTAYRTVGTVGGSTPTMAGALTISGTLLPGNTLTAVPGTLAPSDTDVTYSWYVDGKPVSSSATEDTLDVTPAMAGSKVEVDMTAYNWDSAVTPGCCTDQFYASATANIGGGVSGTKPAITGSAVVGSTLTANDGAWGPSGVSVTHQWLRHGAPIDNATDSAYVLTTADIGKTITVKVSGTLAGGYPVVSKVSDPTASVKGVLTAGTLSISGTATVGETLTAHPGTWSPSGVGFGYQWYAGGSAITGATASTYVPTSTDIGKTITVKVTGNLTNYVTQSKISVATAKVQGVLTAATPSISGDAVVGSTLTANTGSWSPGDVAFAYEWQRDGSPITGADDPTYQLTSSDIGKAITVKVTGTLAGYVSQTKTSDPTSKVLEVFTDPPTPKITGTAEAGSTLTADTGDWGVDGAIFSYQWLRDGNPIDDATQPAYAVTAADRGHGISVQVTASKDGYAEAKQTSAATVIASGFTAAPSPTISGTTVIGKSLTVRTGPWSPAPTFAYQWFRNGKAISGATRTTYKLVTADGGARITVRVTASKAGYETVTRTSKSTAPITRLFAKTPKPKVKGKAKVGKKLHAKHGTWSPKPGFKYQWLRNGKVIKGATHATYKLKKADRGKRIKVRVIARRSGYLAVTKTSKATKKVAR